MRCPCFGEITLLAGATWHQAAMAGDRYKVAMHAINLLALRRPFLNARFKRKLTARGFFSGAVRQTGVPQIGGRHDHWRGVSDINGRRDA